MTHFHRRRGIHSDSPPPLFIHNTSHSHSTSLHSHCQKIHNIGHFFNKVISISEYFFVYFAVHYSIFLKLMV